MCREQGETKDEWVCFCWRKGFDQGKKSQKGSHGWSVNSYIPATQPRRGCKRKRQGSRHRDLVGALICDRRILDHRVFFFSFFKKGSLRVYTYIHVLADICIHVSIYVCIHIVYTYIHIYIFCPLSIYIYMCVCAIKRELFYMLDHTPNCFNGQN